MRIDENCGNPISGGNIKGGTCSDSSSREQELLAEIAELREKVGKLESALNPRLWNEDMSRAWHLNIPDVYQAFSKLKDAAMQQTDKEVKG